MYCNQCGEKVATNSKFCSGCGTPVADKKIATPGQETVNSPISKKIWWLPFLATLVVGGALSATYVYEKNIERDVEAMRAQGETMALDGKLEEAEILLQQALTKRPNHQTLQADLNWINAGQDITKQLQAAQEEVKQGQYAKALALIEGAEGKAKAGQGALYESLQKRVSQKKTAVSVAQVKHEMNNKKTIEELAPLLTKLGSFDVPEAAEAATAIRKQIAGLAYASANDQLKKKQFQPALATVEQGLAYDAGNDKLKSFKDTIAKQQTEFERAEQQRIEQAMVAASKEDEKNRTQAVEVLSIKGQVNEWGDYQVTGEVKNIATRPISMIEVYYEVFDANGGSLGTGYTYVYPNYLAPGETAQFEDYMYSAHNGTQVQVKNATWYVD